MTILYYLAALPATFGGSSMSRTIVRLLSTCGLTAPPWCLKKILFADLKRYQTPQARVTVSLASKLYGINPAEVPALLQCPQVSGLLKVSIPPVAGAHASVDPLHEEKIIYSPPLNYDHILIFSYGRTGSTLLMGLLNTIPGMLIRGENNNALYHLFQFFDALRRTKADHPKAIDSTKAWFGAADLKLSYVLADLRRVAREVLLGQVEHREQIRCLGFKEIRYLQFAEKFEEYVAFLRDVFPNALFIVNRREHAEVMESGFWKNLESVDALAELRSIDKLFDRLPALHPDVFEINYSELTLESSRLRELYERIGAQFVFSSVEAVLGKVHSYAPHQQQIADLAKQ